MLEESIKASLIADRVENMKQESIKASRIAVNNIVAVVYYSTWYRLSLSLIAVNGIALVRRP